MAAEHSVDVVRAGIIAGSGGLITWEIATWLAELDHRVFELSERLDQLDLGAKLGTIDPAPGR